MDAGQTETVQHYMNRYFVIGELTEEVEALNAKVRLLKYECSRRYAMKQWCEEFLASFRKHTLLGIVPIGMGGLISVGLVTGAALPYCGASTLTPPPPVLTSAHSIVKAPLTTLYKAPPKIERAPSVVKKFSPAPIVPPPTVRHSKEIKKVVPLVHKARVARKATPVCIIPTTPATPPSPTPVVAAVPAIPTPPAANAPIAIAAPAPAASTPTAAELTPEAFSSSRSTSDGGITSYVMTASNSSATFTATNNPFNLVVSPLGVVSANGSFAQGTYSVSGTLTDAQGDTGTWTYQLHVTN